MQEEFEPIEEHNEGVKGNVDYVLRILSGPHVGAEVDVVPEKAFVLGKGNTCDVCLVDDLLADQHVTFSFQAGELICTPFEGAEVVVNGEVVEGEKNIEQFQPIVCGTTLMAIGPKDVVWPNIQAPEKIVKSNEVSSQDSKATISSDEAKPEAKHSRRSWLLKLIIISMILCFIAIGTCFLKKNTQSQTQENSFPIVTLKKSIEDVLRKQHVDMKYVKLGLSGQKFVLHCYVATVKDKLELEKQLFKLPKVYFQSLRIYTQETLSEQAQSFLNKYLTLIAAPGAELDTLILKGYLYSIDLLPRIKNFLLENVPGLNGIETSLLSPDEVYELASNLLVQYNLMGLLKIQTVNTGVMISGHIQVSDEPQWQLAQKALKQTFHGVCKVLSYVAVVAPQAVKKLFFPASITTVSIRENDRSWIELKNGDRYFEGALLPSGYKIQSIDTNGIKIQKNKESIFFTLAEL